MNPAPKGRAPILVIVVAGLAVPISVVVAGLGVAGLIGWHTPITAVGSAVLVAIVLCTETAAAVLPVQAAARWAEGRRAVSAAAWAAFAALTVVNVVAGHMGMVAVNAAAVAERRAPLEAAALEADAQAAAASRALALYDEQTARLEARWDDRLRATPAIAVTAGARASEAADAAIAARAAGRQPYAEADAEARAARDTARAALAAAPRGRPDHELWLVAAILELLKGALVFLATPRPARRRRSDDALLDVEQPLPELVKGLDDVALATLERRARQVAASAQHERTRRRVA